MSAITDRLSSALADRYRIERELGAGGMATVYLAHDIKHDRKVALKVLKPELAAVIGAERFLGEIRTTANLQHPHILALFDSGQVDGTVFYVMPFVEGESLRDRLSREKQLPIPEAIRIATEIAGALSYAHRHGVIHRDIKPENILLHDGQALVADFGIALAASSTGGGRLTETGMSLGTPTYMSPEQAMGERTIDARADIYALGCVLYEMLVGDPPHIGSTAQAIVAKVLTERPASIIAQRDRVPVHVEVAVLTALSKLPADRFEGAKQFADALNDPSKAPVAIHMSHAGRRSSRALLGWSAAVAGAAVLGYLVAPGSSVAASAADSADPVLRFEAQLPVALSNDQFTILPDGSGLLVLGGGSEGHGIYLRRFADTVARYLTATDAMIGMYATHDVSGIAYYTWPGIGLSRVRMVSIAGGPSRTVTDSVRLGLALDDAGNIYGSHHLHFGLTRVSSDGVRTDVLTRPDTAAGENTHAWPEMLPNGRGVLFEVAYRTDRRPELAVYDLSRNEMRRLIPGSRPRYLENGYLIFNDADGVVAAVRFDAKRLTIEGGPVPVLARSGGYSVSQNGTLLQRELSERGWSLVRVAPAGMTTLARGSGQPPSSFRLHADGRMAVSTARGISFYSPDGTERPLSLPNGVEIGGWHEGGRRLAYVRSLTAGERRATKEAQSVPSDGSAPPSALFGARVRIPPGLRDLDIGASGVAFSANGRAWWLPRDDTLPADLGPLTNRPRISPDGRFIALERGEQTGAQVVVVLAVPPATGSWEVGTGSSPRWSGDGRFLYFAGPTRMYQQSATPVMRVAVRVGDAFAFGAVTPVADPPPGATVAWEVGPRDGAIHWITAPVGRRAIVTANWSRVVDSLVRAAERTR